MEEENENIEEDTEKNGDDDVFQSQESNELLINNKEINDDAEDNLDVVFNITDTEKLRMR